MEVVSSGAAAITTIFVRYIL